MFRWWVNLQVLIGMGGVSGFPPVGFSANTPSSLVDSISGARVYCVLVYCRRSPFQRYLACSSSQSFAELLCFFHLLLAILDAWDSYIFLRCSCTHPLRVLRPFIMSYGATPTFNINCDFLLCSIQQSNHLRHMLKSLCRPAPAG